MTSAVRHRHERSDPSGICNLDLRMLDRGFGRPVEGRVRDLIDIVVLCYGYDRLSPRPSSQHELPWKRTMDVPLPVREPGFWIQAEVAEALTEFIDWLTGDEWILRFYGGREFLSGMGPAVSTLGIELDPEGEVGLFSGGADSLAGAAIQRQRSAGPLTLVGASTNSRMTNRQRRLAEGVRRISRSDVRYLRVPMSLRATSVTQEPSQRTRAAVFLTLGAVAAWSLGLKRFSIFENGVGSINLPYLAFQHGTHNTRATHPRTARLAERLYRLVFDRDMHVEQPHLFHTKAEMLSALRPVYRALLPISMSCDTGFTYRSGGQLQCGTCTSCLLRRQALRGAGLELLDVGSEYRTDVSKPADGDDRAFRAMLDQAAHIQRLLAHEHPWTALAAAFPQLAELHQFVPGTDVQVARALARMYGAYVDEWKRFPGDLVGRYVRPDAPRDLDQISMPMEVLA